MIKKVLKLKKKIQTKFCMRNLHFIWKIFTEKNSKNRKKEIPKICLKFSWATFRLHNFCSTIYLSFWNFFRDFFAGFLLHTLHLFKSNAGKQVQNFARGPWTMWIRSGETSLQLKNLAFFLIFFKSSCCWRVEHLVTKPSLTDFATHVFQVNFGDFCD